MMLVAALVAACGGSSVRGPAAPPSPVVDDPAAPPTGVPAPPTATPLRQLDAEAAITTAWGATLTVPASFWIAERADEVEIQDPEREATLHFTTVQAADSAAAIAAAWQRVQPGFALAIADSDDLPGRDGWDAMTQTAYVTKTEESRAVVALARQQGDTWHVTTIDAKTAALGRRGAQINALILDMKVPGIDQESFAGQTPNLDAAHLARFDAFVEEARTLAGVPGVAIAIVHGGEIVLEAGHGVRTAGQRKPVSPATLFLIGSTTKSLTTLMLARLIDQQKFTWETPVVDVLPSFALADPAISKQVLVKHTVCACTGMPRQDLEFLFEYAGWNAERRLASLATMKPTTGFGETFQYSNVMVATGGWLGAHAFAPKAKLGPAYHQAMSALVFKPLGMTATTFDFKQAARADHASSHGRDLQDTYQEIPLGYERAVSSVEPAGAAWSNVRDLARFMMLELADGKTPNGKQLVSVENLERRRAPQVKIDADNAYGLGLFLTSDHGVRIIHHGGNMLGFTSDLFLLPDADVGVVVLANGGAANSFRSAVRRGFLEIVYDGKPLARENLATSIERSHKDLAEELALHEVNFDAWIAPMLGGYDNPALGHLELRKVTMGKAPGPVATAFELDAGEWTTRVVKKTDRDGTVKLITTEPPYLGLELVPTLVDGQTTLVLDAAQQVYAFTPTPTKSR